MKYLSEKEIKMIDKIIADALHEDIGKGDITSEILINKNQKFTTELLLKENAVIAGLDIFSRVLKKADSKIKVKFFSKDGKFYKKGKVLAKIHGNARKILKAERVALNILQRMSGIATKVNKMKKLLNNPRIKLLDTRKTTPNFRILEKLAVKAGGGQNHRFGLHDMILIKDNHVDACGGIPEVLKKLRKNLEKIIPVEIEVRNFKEFIEVKENSGGFVDIVMLDNFSFNNLKKVLNYNRKEFRIEISGGINERNIKKYSKVKGIDYISLGSLTHSYKSTDISLNFII
ncbi:MAG: carboxylating nicotinate-nucleotide diphosphorylase [Ignavibacteria bacterium]|nr:carboxylating nicotinate-nucleotide diphosphorylase [Ignavibacteria bacterium]